MQTWAKIPRLEGLVFFSRRILQLKSILTGYFHRVILYGKRMASDQVVLSIIFQSEACLYSELLFNTLWKVPSGNHAYMECWEFKCINIFDISLQRCR